VPLSSWPPGARTRADGIAIDGEEVALLLEHLGPERALRAILRRSKKPDTTEI